MKKFTVKAQDLTIGEIDDIVMSLSSNGYQCTDIDDEDLKNITITFEL